MKKIAIIMPDVPFPPTSGGQKAIYWRVVELCKYYDVHLICVNSNKRLNYSTDVTYFECEKLASNIKVFDRISPNIDRTNILKSTFQVIKWIFSGHPRFAQTFQSSVIKEDVTKYIFSNNIGTVCLESPYVAELIDIPRLKSSNVKLACVMHNIEHILFKEVYGRDSWIREFFFSFECKRIKKYEYKVLALMDVCIGISDWDVNFIRKEIKCKAEYAPALLPCLDSVFEDEKISNYIVFSGQLSFYPNYHGIMWFLENVFNQYNKNHPEVKLKITGNVHPGIRKQLEKYNNIELTGFLSDTELNQMLSEALFDIVPIQKGAGVKIKLLEALSMGIPVITTYKGAQGIPIKDEIFLVAENSQDFLDYMLKLTVHTSLRKQLSLAEKLLFNEEYEVKNNIYRWINILEEGEKRSIESTF